MRCRMIGGPRHGQSVVVPEPPLEHIQVVEEGPMLWRRNEYRVEQYWLARWVFADFRGTVERLVYLHSAMTKEDALPYIQGWFETGVIAPLGVPIER